MRYELKEEKGVLFIVDTKTGKALTLRDIVDTLNRLHFKANSDPAKRGTEPGGGNAWIRAKVLSGGGAA